MTVRVLKDVTLTVKAGQAVEVSNDQAAIALRLGFVEVLQAEKPAKKQTAKKTAREG